MPESHCSRAFLVSAVSIVAFFLSLNITSIVSICILSSPRAESARAVTGRREDFLSRQQDFFYGNGCNSGTENCSQGGKSTVMPRAKNGSLTKIGVVWQKSDFWTKNQNFGQKKGTHFLTLTMFWPRPEKVVQRKKVPLPK